MNRRRGATLFELLVYLAVFSVVGSGVAGTLIIGNRWYMQNRALISAQESADTAARRLAREIIESHLTGVTFFPNASRPNSTPGVVFISPHDPASSNRFRLNPMTGNTQWFKYVCFYVDTDPASDNPGALAIFRKEYAPWSNTSSSIDALPQPCPNDTNWFRSQPFPAIIVAHNIASAAVSPPRGGFLVFSGAPGTPSYDSAFNPITISITTNVPYHSTVQNIVNTTISVSVRN